MFYLTHFIYSYMASESILHTTAFITPVAEHWLEIFIGSSIRDI